MLELLFLYAFHAFIHNSVVNSLISQLIFLYTLPDCLMFLFCCIIFTSILSFISNFILYLCFAYDMRASTWINEGLTTKYILYYGPFVKWLIERIFWWICPWCHIIFVISICSLFHDQPILFLYALNCLHLCWMLSTCRFIIMYETLFSEDFYLYPRLEHYREFRSAYFWFILMNLIMLLLFFYWLSTISPFYWMLLIYIFG